MLVTAKGVVKQLALDEVRDTKAGKTLIKLKNGDRVAAAFCVPKKADILFVTSDGQVLRTTGDEISIQGRGASGVAGMKVRGDAQIIYGGVILGDDVLFTISNDGLIKATAVTEFDTKGRNGVGVRVGKLIDSAQITTAYLGQPFGLLCVMTHLRRACPASKSRGTFRRNRSGPGSERRTNLWRQPRRNAAYRGG